jgi:hypothetical protein
MTHVKPVSHKQADCVLAALLQIFVTENWLQVFVTQNWKIFVTEVWCIPNSSDIRDVSYGLLRRSIHATTKYAYNARGGWRRPKVGMLLKGSQGMGAPIGTSQIQHWNVALLAGYPEQSGLRSANRGAHA